LQACHGAEDDGTAQAPSLIPFDWSYEEALELVRHPVCNMPPMPASVVSDAQVAQIVTIPEDRSNSRPCPRSRDTNPENGSASAGPISRALNS